MDAGALPPRAGAACWVEHDRARRGGGAAAAGGRPRRRPAVVTTAARRFGVVGALAFAAHHHRVRPHPPPRDRSGTSGRQYSRRIWQDGAARGDGPRRSCALCLGPRVRRPEGRRSGRRPALAAAGGGVRQFYCSRAGPTSGWRCRSCQIAAPTRDERPAKHGWPRFFDIGRHNGAAIATVTASGSADVRPDLERDPLVAWESRGPVATAAATAAPTPVPSPCPGSSTPTRAGGWWTSSPGSATRSWC
jgi:hypothetical protein